MAHSPVCRWSWTARGPRWWPRRTAGRTCWRRCRTRTSGTCGRRTRRWTRCTRRTRAAGWWWRPPGNCSWPPRRRRWARTRSGTWAARRPRTWAGPAAPRADSPRSVPGCRPGRRPPPRCSSPAWPGPARTTPGPRPAPSCSVPSRTTGWRGETGLEKNDGRFYIYIFFFYNWLGSHRFQVARKKKLSGFKTTPGNISLITFITLSSWLRFGLRIVFNGCFINKIRRGVISANNITVTMAHVAVTTLVIAVNNTY